MDPIIFHRAEGFLRRACEKLRAWATISSERIVEGGRLHQKQTGSALLTVRGTFNGPAILTLDTKIDDDMTLRMGRRDSSATLFTLLTQKEFLNEIRSPRKLLLANRTVIMYTFHSNRYLRCLHILIGIIDVVYISKPARVQFLDVERPLYFPRGEFIMLQ